jgi:hypothetical protein
MKNILLATTALLALTVSAQAQKAIFTGGEKGAYHSTFCPPLPNVLNQSMFSGYRCTPSGGTLENIQQVLSKPSNIGFVQLDVLAREMADKPDLPKQLTVIRKDIACEGLWMVTKNEKLKTYGDVLGYARRINFVLPPQGSGSAASFNFIQKLDPDGLGRAAKLRYVNDATTVINTVAAGGDDNVGFFVQFADPENANIRLMVEKGLIVVPVVSREITNAKVGDESLYNVQSFGLKAGGFFVSGDERVTACTPVAVITGNPEAQKDSNAKLDQKDLIKAVQDVPASSLLPQDSRLAKLMQTMKRVSASTIAEMSAAAEKAKKAAEQLAN